MWYRLYIKRSFTLWLISFQHSTAFTVLAQQRMHVLSTVVFKNTGSKSQTTKM